MPPSSILSCLYLGICPLESHDWYTCNMVHVGPFSFLACFPPFFVLEPMFQSLLLGGTVPSESFETLDRYLTLKV